jgi:WD40 repeat protein
VAKLDHFKGKIPELFSNYLRIQHLTSEAARDAIKKPLEVYSEIAKADPPFTIESQLVDEVCKQVRASSDFIADAGPGAAETDSGTTHVETSYLQLVMTRLWDFEFARRSHRLRLETLHRLGGATNIVQDHLNFNLIGFPDEEQEAAAEIFHYLVTPSGTKVAFSAPDLAKLTELPEERVEAVLEKLCAGDTRILRSYYADRPRGNVKSYEIYHDVLANAVLGWRAWYLRDKDRIRMERDANAQKEAENARLREEEERRRRQEELRLKRARRKMRRLLVIAALSTIITGVFAALYFYAVRQERNAQEAAHEAELRKAEAQQMLSVVNDLDRSVAYFQAVMRGHTGPVLGVDINRDRTQVVTAGADNTARVWDAQSGKLLQELKGHTGAVRSALFSPDGRLIATASNDLTARVWEVGSGLPPRIFGGHVKEVSAARFSDDGRLIVTASDDGTARVWDTATVREIRALKAHSGAVTYAAFSPDGKRVVTGGADANVLVWEVETGNYMLLGIHGNEVNTAVFSHDGKQVVTASSDREARVWDTNGGKSFPLKGHAGPVNSAAFSTDGTLVVTASDDRTARVWDVKTRQPPAPKVLEGHSDAVLGASFSDNGARVITASADKTARVWDVGTGKVLFELRGHTDAVNQAVFSQEGGELAATASQDKTARTWDIGGEGGLRITDLALSVVPDNHSGPCPVGVRISASITAVGSGTIKYRFVRSGDRYIGPERTLRFETSGTKEVSTSWLFGRKAPSTSAGAIQVEITSLQPYLRKETTYTIKCIPRGARETPNTTSPAPPPPTPTPTPQISPSPVIMPE